MARVAIKLTPKHTGGYSARKRIPTDVLAEYSRQFSKSAEERFTTGPDVSLATAKVQAHEWLAEIESRIASIRAARRGGGRALTSKQALALAGEWYVWFVRRHEEAPGTAGHWQARWLALLDDLEELAPPAVQACRPRAFDARLEQRHGSRFVNIRAHSRRRQHHGPHNSQSAPANWLQGR
jgi:hypothetical protein